MPSGDAWISYRKPRPRARMRLLCFPYAGGGALVYRSWAAAMPEEIDVLPVLLPGRERRLAEAPYRRMEPLVDALAQALAPYFDLPFAIFGHSLGAAVGFELAHRLRRERGTEPAHLLVSARAAPQLPPERTTDHLLPDDRLRERLRELDGTPPEVLAHPELMELVLPMIRADLEIHETYQAVGYPPLSCPVTAFGGSADHEVKREELEAWGEVTTGAFELVTFAGGHFFLHEATEALVRSVAEALRR